MWSPWKLLPFAALASIANATVHQYCTAFEGPLNGFSPAFKVGSPSHQADTLILHIRDMVDDYRKRTVVLDRWVPVDGVIQPVGVAADVTGNTPSSLNASAIINYSKISEFPIINTTINAGEGLVEYTIPSAGIYCSLVHWNGPQDFKGSPPLLALTEHSYGGNSLLPFWPVAALLTVAALWAYRYILVPKLFPVSHQLGEFGECGGVVFCLLGRLVDYWSQLSYTKALLYIDGNTQISPGGTPFDRWIILEKLLSLGLTWVVYIFIKGVAMWLEDRYDTDSRGHDLAIFFSGFVSATVSMLTLYSLPLVSSSGIAFSLCLDVSAAFCALVLSWGVEYQDELQSYSFYFLWLIFFPGMMSWGREGDRTGAAGIPVHFGFLGDVRLSCNHMICLGYVYQVVTHWLGFKSL